MSDRKSTRDLNFSFSHFSRFELRSEHSLLRYLINSARESVIAARQTGVLDEVNILQISVPIF